jgi:hypothetical protein
MDQSHIAEVEKRLREEIKSDHQAYLASDKTPKDFFKCIIVDINDRMIEGCKCDLYKIFSLEQYFPNAEFSPEVVPYLYLVRKAARVHETFIYLLTGSQKPSHEVESEDPLTYMSIYKYLGPDWPLWATPVNNESPDSGNESEEGGWTIEGFIESSGVTIKPCDYGHPLYNHIQLAGFRSVLCEGILESQFSSKMQEEVRKQGIAFGSSDFNKIGDIFKEFSKEKKVHQRRNIKREYLCLMYWESFHQLCIANLLPNYDIGWSPLTWLSFEETPVEYFNEFVFNFIETIFDGGNSVNGTSTTDYDSFARWYRKHGLQAYKPSPIKTSPNFLSF